MNYLIHTTTGATVGMQVDLRDPNDTVKLLDNGKRYATHYRVKQARFRSDDCAALLLRYLGDCGSLVSIEEIP